MKLERENLKRRLENNEDITEIKTRLDELVIVSDNYKNNNASTDSRTRVDNSSLHHAADHIKMADQDSVQKSATIQALAEPDDYTPEG